MAFCDATALLDLGEERSTKFRAEADRRFAIALGRDIGPSSPALSARCTDEPLRLTHFELIDYLCRVARSLQSQYRQVPVLRTVQERLEP
jgi:hypothetical protein